jgi:transcriptional regulator with XRE-family HTH domain
MKRLKQLREAFNLTQQDLAEKLKTSQQAIARWENGKSEPNLSVLKDLALFFGTSVDELLSYGATGKKFVTKHRSFSKEEFDGFWGHIGLKIAGKPSLWFPITEGTMNEIYNKIKNMNKENEWLMFETLANKFVACRPAGIERLGLLDDDADHPQDDWKITLPYSGLSLEIYSAFDVLEDSLSLDEWKKANEIITKPNKRDKLTNTDMKSWREIVKKLVPLFEGKASGEFVGRVAEEFAKYSLYEWENYYQTMLAINVYREDGSVEDFLSESEDIDNLIFTLDNLEFENLKFINFTRYESPVFMPLSKISVITVPYTEVLKAEKESEEEFEKDFGFDSESK